MKLLTSLSILAFAAFLPVHADDAQAVKSSSSTGEPEIQADGHVTFRLKAPQASEVTVAGQSIPKTTMTKDDAGVWSATVGPVPAGVWEYSFYVDGVQTVDINNPAIKPQRAPRVSILQIPSSPAAPWDFRPDIAHGTMHWHDYFAKSLQARRRLHVYTPPGYERETRKYPVLYLVHGFSDNDAAWSVHGKANLILDNLIADKKAVPMIVVMPDGHALAPENRARQDYGSANNSAFEHELIEDVIPMIDSTYRAQPSADYRALAGLSMGGGHTLYTGPRHLDKFGWLGTFSAGIPNREGGPEGLLDAQAVNHALHLFWMGCGKSDSLMERNRKLHDFLTEKGIQHVWVESDGGHEWPVWRNYLVQFASLVFAPEKGIAQH